MKQMGTMPQLQNKRHENMQMKQSKNRPYRSSPLRVAPDSLTKHPTQIVQEGGGAEVELGEGWRARPVKGT